MQSYIFPDTPSAEALAATTGFFDGVHCGHLAVLQQLKNIALQHHLPTAVVSYAPHPRIVLGKTQNILLLNTIEEKKLLLEAQNIDYFIIIPFTKEFAQLSAHHFVQQYLQQQLHVKQWIIGYDHRMGSGAGDDFVSLRDFCTKQGIALSQTPAMTMDKMTISSSKIRNALIEGKLADANRMLNYHYTLSGIVTHGEKKGRTLSFPTANLMPDKEKLLPRNGVYAVWAEVRGKRYKAALNIGFRPTLSHTQTPSVEVHVFDFDQDIYGESMRVGIVERLRDEQRFTSLDALKAAIAKDKQQATGILKNDLFAN
jgi:riboflavin kinase/FMN adenylyltransferase